MCDCVIGYGSHPNPAEDPLRGHPHRQAEAEAAGRHLCCVCAVCGTEGRPQCLSKTQKQLSDAGAVVLPSNAQATRFVERILANLK